MPRLIFAAPVLTLALLLPPPAHAQQPKQPNILVILSDDHSAAHVGCYGNKDIKTPNLDKFAANGMRFNRAYVTCPQCVPSRASYMTGRSPVALQMTRFTAPLPAEVKIYPELLKQHGYYAGVAGRTYHLDGAAGPQITTDTLERFQLKTFPKRLDFVKVAPGKAGVVVDQFRQFLDQVPQGKPFVLQLCFHDPHRPYDKNAVAKPHDSKTITLPVHFPDTPLVREDFAHYYDEIARLDEYLGQVFEELKKRGLDEVTIIIFVGDNGAALLRGKGTLYDFGLHVPMLVRWPGRTKKGSVSDELISGEDLAPTLLEAAGVPVPKEMTGKSFVKLLAGEQQPGRKYVFAERGAHGSGLPNQTAAFDLGRCVIGKRHKLIYNALWQLPYTPVDFAGEPFWKELQQMHKNGKLAPQFSQLYFAPQRSMFELFDLEADPHEFKNLFGTKDAAEVQQEFMNALQEWMILERDFLPLPQPVPVKKKAKG